MKPLASRLALTLLALALSSPSTAQDVESTKACKSTSTSGRCLLALITTLNTKFATLQGQVTTLQSSNATLTSELAILTSQVTALQSSNTSLQSNVTTLTSEASGLQTALTSVQNNHALELGPYVSVDSGEENGLKGPHLIFRGANVHVESGSGTTVDTTGLGNLVVGYDEDSLAPSAIDSNRTGSHNLVIGPQHEFTASGGVVSGYANFTSANYSSVTGGECNAAGSAPYAFACTKTGGAADAASVSGGLSGIASSFESSVSGGTSNTASGTISSISGGQNNTASGPSSSICGGWKNTASNFQASVSGGYSNTASNDQSSVSGGESNTASGLHSSILGGDGNTISTTDGTYP
jgi:hypothetical protein